MGKVYVMWGRRPGAEEWQEELLSERNSREEIRSDYAVAKRNGWEFIRVSGIDLSQFDSADPCGFGSSVVL